MRALRRGRQVEDVLGERRRVALKVAAQILEDGIHVPTDRDLFRVPGPVDIHRNIITAQDKSSLGYKARTPLPDGGETYEGW